MNATQPSFDSLRPVSAPHPSSRSSGQHPRRRLRQRAVESPKAIAVETSIKLMVNLFLAGVAVSSLVTLAPDYQARREKLDQLQAAIRMTERQTSHLRSEFSRYFDPRQANRIMQEQSGGGDPLTPQIVWVDPAGQEP